MGEEFGIGFAVGCLVMAFIIVGLLIINPVSTEYNHLGQIICSEQYGKDRTTFQSFDSAKGEVYCKEIQQPEKKPFDGVYTIKVKQ